MSLSKRLLRLAFLALPVLAAPLLAACTLTPIYSDNVAAKSSLQLAFAKPASRVEQIINQDLAFRLGTSDAPNAVQAKVSATSSVRSLAVSTTINPNRPYEVTVVATLTLKVSDVTPEKVIVLTRQATASFTQDSQVLADTATQAGAAEQAAHSVAESLRLAVLATLSR